MRFRSLSPLALCPALVCLALLAAPAPSQAQGCLPDCFGDAFGPLQNTVLTLGPGCQVQVTYSTRLACGTWHDLYIEYIQSVPTPPSSLCQGYFAMDSKDLLGLVTLEMFKDNPMGFPQTVPGCTTNWRVVKGTCWFTATDPMTGRHSASYCDGSVCCLEAVELCQDECGNETCFDIKGGTIPPSACENQGPEPGLCTVACGDVDWDTDGC